MSAPPTAAARDPVNPPTGFAVTLGGFTGAQAAARVGVSYGPGDIRHPETGRWGSRAPLERGRFSAPSDEGREEPASVSPRPRGGP